MLSLVSFIFSAPEIAAKEKASIRIWGQATPFASGAAGDGEDAPDFNDAFKTGLGGGGEFAWRFCRWFSGVAGLGYEVYDGDTYEEVAFDNLEIVPIYAGGKFHLLQDQPSWDLYLRLDVGVAHLSSVDIRYRDLKGRYWESCWSFLFDIGGGLEYRWGQWGASLEVKARHVDAPDPALGKPSESGSFWTVPVVLGINYHF
jgi:hypothetical protein